MINTSVNICGIEFKNPVIAASGTFGLGMEYSRIFDVSQLGGIALKALSIEKIDGNPPPRIAETASGILNAIGLQNPGIETFLKYALPQCKKMGTVLIANVIGKSIDEYVRVIEALKGDSVDMIELNISCPNVKTGMQFGVDPNSVKEITCAVKKVCDKPLIVKLSPNVSDITKNALAAQDAGADAISLINTITGMAVNPFTRRPILTNLVGGLSGPAIKPIALRMVYDVCKCVSIPVIGMGGISSGTDAAEFMMCGASAVMVGSATISDPLATVRIIDELAKFLESQNCSAADLVGTLKV